MGRILVFLLIGYFIYILFKKNSAAKVVKKQEEAKEETFRDPVCGVYVAADDAVIGRHDGQRIHFCSMACLEKYQEQVAHNPGA